ncbi:MAG: hypothetical protein OXH50_16950 [Gemmatimonadetes bacterium]|nr:hypothetical protein [Gemmatimonadota bacterium]
MVLGWQAPSKTGGSAILGYEYEYHPADLQFRPSRAREETTVEIFFDMSQSDTYGVEQGPWSDFRPDYVVGVTGSNGALTKEFYWRWTGNAWDKKEGADIPEVEIAFATRYLEGAMYWKLLDVPDTDRPYYELGGGFQLSQGGAGLEGRVPGLCAEWRSTLEERSDITHAC